MQPLKHPENDDIRWYNLQSALRISFFLMTGHTIRNGLTLVGYDYAHRLIPNRFRTLHVLFELNMQSFPFEIFLMGGC